MNGQFSVSMLLRHKRSHKTGCIFNTKRFTFSTWPLSCFCQLHSTIARFAHLLLAPQSCPLLVWDIFVSAKLYCGIINQDSTRVVCSNGRCCFTSNTLVSAVQTGFRKLDWNTGIALTAVKAFSWYNSFLKSGYSLNHLFRALFRWPASKSRGSKFTCIFL